MYSIENTFIIGDTHFGHKNIIAYENRPFSSVEEMDETLINNWNSVVTDDDLVIVNGDYSFYSAEKTKQLTQRLNGAKTLILGNHDELSQSVYLDCGFNEVYAYPIIYMNFIMISHQPLYTNSNMPYANIFAHVHSCSSYTDYSENSFCTSCERRLINYRPISVKDIIATVNGARDNAEKPEIVNLTADYPNPAAEK